MRKMLPLLERGEVILVVLVEGLDCSTSPTHSVSTPLPSLVLLMWVGDPLRLILKEDVTLYCAASFPIGVPLISLYLGICCSVTVGKLVILNYA